MKPGFHKKSIEKSSRIPPLYWLLIAFAFLVREPALAGPLAAQPTPKEMLAAGRVDDAIEALQQQINRSPTDAESYNLLCRAYFMLDEWDRGIPACERARVLAPEISMYHLWLGRIYGEKASHAGFLSAAGMAKKVRASFERAVELDPKNWEARTDLAEFYLEAPGIVGGGKDKARAQADMIMPLNPGLAHWVAARIFEKEKDSIAAERELRAEIAASHSGCRGWFDLASFLRHANRMEEMDEALHNLESGPIDHPAALVDGAGMLLRTNHDLALGVRLVRRYFSNGPIEEAPAFKVYDVLGQLLEKQGDRQAAAEQYRASLALAHSYTRAQEDLKRVTR